MHGSSYCDPNGKQVKDKQTKIERNGNYPIRLKLMTKIGINKTKIIFTPAPA